MNRLIAAIAVSVCLLIGASAEAKTYTFSQSGSSIKFFNKASLHGIEGTAKSFGGTLDSASLTGSLVVKTASMTTDLGPRDKKMHEFCLESVTFPAITFDVKSIEGGEALQNGEGAGQVTLVGSLTIRDVSKSVRIAADYAFVDTGLKLTGRYDFKWTDYGVPDPSIIISKLYPEMNVQFTLNAQ